MLATPATSRSPGFTSEYPMGYHEDDNTVSRAQTAGTRLLHKEAECAYTLFVIATFWLTEALPLSVTALLPGLMFPLFGIMTSKKVASAYFKDFHLLLIGVICLATSIEKWNLHRRIALRMVMTVGVNPT
ncbi:hypothetical protein GH733_013457, partial [Mirounga leonina]